MLLGPGTTPYAFSVSFPRRGARDWSSRELEQSMQAIWAESEGRACDCERTALARCTRAIVFQTATRHTGRQGGPSARRASAPAVRGMHVADTPPARHGTNPTTAGHRALAPERGEPAPRRALLVGRCHSSSSPSTHIMHPGALRLQPRRRRPPIPPVLMHAPVGFLFSRIGRAHAGTIIGTYS